MKKEYSYGAVVYRHEGDKLMILIEYMALGHVSIPKGHIERGETPVECAKREIREETSLDVDLNTDFSNTITYSPMPDVSKDVTFYLATPKSEALIPQLSEVSSLRWLEAYKAVEAVTFDTDKETITKAVKYITEHNL